MFQAIFGLAVAYTGVWNQKQNASDKAKAIQFAEKTLQIKPDFKEAYALINRLNKQKPVQKP